MIENKVHLIIPDQHAHPDYDNRRAEYVGHFINRCNPDVVINIGDGADMPSLCSYDKGTRGFEGRRYSRDIEAAIDFQDRLWWPVRKRKQRMPHRYYFIGNHEHRITRVGQVTPELHGTISLNDLQLDRYYDDVVHYNGSTPGVRNVDGVDYAHYFISGVSGRPISGEHPAYSLLTKRFVSSTSGHLHLADYTIRTAGDNQKIMGCFCGVYQDYQADFAGNANSMWWSGLVLKRFISYGTYDIQFISMERLTSWFKDE